MRNLILILGSLSLCTNGNILFRDKRQLEVEGDPQVNSETNDVVVIKDINNDNGPSYQLIPVDPNTGIGIGVDSDGNGSSGTDVVDLDINEDDGTFRLGGRIPSLHFHHSSFADMFRAIQQRFDEMARRMAENFGHSIDTSSGSMFPNVHGSCCGHGIGNSDGQGSGGEGTSASGEGGLGVASLPENYNNTKTEIITIRGRQFLKKTTVIRKGGPGTSIYISSTTYEPINEADNGATGSDESDLKPASSGSGSDGSSGTNYSPDGSNVSSSSTTEASSSEVPSQPVPKAVDESEAASSGSSSTTSTTESGLEREELTSPTPVVPV